MIKGPSGIEFHFFKGKTPEKCGAKCFIKSIEKGTVYYFHRHNFIEFEYVESGKLINGICGSESVVGPGDFYAVGLENFHKVEIAEDSSIFSLSLFPKLLPSSIQKLLSKFSFPVAGNIPEGKRREIMLWLRRIRHMLFHDEPACEEKIKGYLFLYLSTALEYSRPIENKKERGKYKHILGATEYIQNHYQEDISLSDVAKALYLSPNHLSKIFTEVNGMSISQYLTEFRLEIARAELMTTKKSITDVAMDCGGQALSRS